MSIFCRLFGHTWLPETRAPEPRWNTTKDGDVLRQIVAGDATIRHVDICRRCGDVRDAGPRRHDVDRPDADIADAAAAEEAGA